MDEPTPITRAIARELFPRLNGKNWKASAVRSLVRDGVTVIRMGGEKVVDMAEYKARCAEKATAMKERKG